MNENIYLTGEYADKHPTYHTENSPWKAQQILTMLNRHNLRPQTVCEVGCGAGEILRQLQVQLPESTVFEGYEISPQAYDLAVHRSNERLHFFCEDLLAKETPPYELMLCMDVIEHVEDCFGFTRTLHRKATHTIFHIPLDMNVQTVLRRKPILYVRNKVGHIHYFMKDTALALLQDAGYEVIDWFYTVSSDNAKGLKPALMRLPRKVMMALSADVAVRTLGGASLLVLAR